jgi:mannose-6-phosphate isomerase-like protein (cupin superfamily)
VHAAVGATNPAIGNNRGGLRPLHALILAVRRILNPRAKHLSMKDNQIKAVSPARKSDTQTMNTEQDSEWRESQPGEWFRVCTSAAQTNGAYSVVEIVAERGHGTPIHVHENEDEHFVVVEGTAHMVRGDEAFEATAGAAISLRKGIPHAWGNRSDTPLRLVVTNVPGGIEEALRLLANGVDVGAVAEQFAVRAVGPKI